MAMESLSKWINGLGYYNIDFYGLDISEELVELTKCRLPHWRDNFFIGNALTWLPSMRYDFVCVKELSYVPRDRQRAFFKHLIECYVLPRGRLILGPYSEERKSSEIKSKLSSWGYEPTGFVEKSHYRHKDLARKVLWWDTNE